MNNETEKALERARHAAARAGKVADRRAQVRGDREQIARKLERIRAEEARLKEEADAEALLHDGGGAAVAAEQRTRMQQLQGRRDELATRLDQVEREHRQAQEEKEAAALEAVRALRRELEEALADLRDALEEMGEGDGPVAARYAEVVEAREQVGDLSTNIRHWAGQSSATPMQKRKLKGHLRDFGRDLSGAGLVGWALAETFGWLARFDGPVGDHLSEHGVKPVEGSARHSRPFGALEEVVAALEQGRIPGGTGSLT